MREETTKSIWADDADEEEQNGTRICGGGDHGDMTTEERAQNEANFGWVHTYNMDQPKDTDDENSETRPSPPKGPRFAMANPKAAPRPAPMSGAAAPQPPPPPAGADHGMNAQLMDMLRQMQAQQQQQAEESARKDSIILQLQQTIASLQVTIQAMHQSFNPAAAAQGPTAAAEQQAGGGADAPQQHPQHQHQQHGAE